jgi:hypothetical protein
MSYSPGGPHTVQQERESSEDIYKLKLDYDYSLAKNGRLPLEVMTMPLVPQQSIGSSLSSSPLATEDVYRSRQTHQRHRSRQSSVEQAYTYTSASAASTAPGSPAFHPVRHSHSHSLQENGSRAARESSTPPSSLTPSSSRRSWDWEDKDKDGRRGSQSSGGKEKQRSKRDRHQPSGSVEVRKEKQSNAATGGHRRQPSRPRTSSKQVITQASTVDEVAVSRRPSRRRAMTGNAAPHSHPGKLSRHATSSLHDAIALHERSKRLFAADGGVEAAYSYSNSHTPAISSLEVSPTPSSADLLATSYPGDMSSAGLAGMKGLSKTKSASHAKPMDVAPPPLPKNPPIPTSPTHHGLITDGLSASLPSRPPLHSRTQTEPMPASRQRPSTSHQHSCGETTSAKGHGPLQSASVELLSLSHQFQAEFPPADTAAATTHYWTSDETRRREYAAIDRRNKGIRGLFNKFMPRLGKKSNRSKFYDENDDDKSDAGSVRRYRLNLDS